MNDIVLGFHHLDIISNQCIAIHILMALCQETSPCTEVTPSKVGRHHEDFLRFLHDSIVNRDVLTLRITQIDFSLLLVCTINTAHALENLGNAWLVNTEGIDDGCGTHHEDTGIPEETLILNILSSCLQIWFLPELINTEDFLVTSRRSTQICLNIAIACLWTSRLHSQSNDAVSLTSKLQGRCYHSSEFVGIGNDMIRRRYNNICMRILFLDSPTDIGDARSCVSSAWFLQNITLRNLRQLLVNQGCILFIGYYPNILRVTDTLKTIECKL